MKGTLYLSPAPSVASKKESDPVGVIEDLLCQYLAFKVYGRGQGRERIVANAELLEEVRNIQARLEVMEATQRCNPDTGDVNDREEESLVEEGEPIKETVEIIFLRSVLGASSRPKTKVPTYYDSLSVEKLVD